MVNGAQIPPPIGHLFDIESFAADDSFTLFELFF